MKVNRNATFMLVVLTALSCGDKSNAIAYKNDSKDEYHIHAQDPAEDKVTADTLSVETDFLKYLKSIKELKRDQIITSENTADLGFFLESSYIPDGASILGKVTVNQKRFYVIYLFSADIVIPIMYEYDSIGNKLNEHELFDYNYCSDIMNINQVCGFKINNDDTIEMLHINEETIEVFKTLSLNDSN